MAAQLLHSYHDTFKLTRRPGAPIAAPNSHASLARAFLAEFCDEHRHTGDGSVPRRAVRAVASIQVKGRLNEERLATLMTSIRDWNLFLASHRDGCTQGKQRDSLRWLFRLVAGRVESRFAEADIL